MDVSLPATLERVSPQTTFSYTQGHFLLFPPEYLEECFVSDQESYYV